MSLVARRLAGNIDRLEAQLAQVGASVPPPVRGVDGAVRPEA